MAGAGLAGCSGGGGGPPGGDVETDGASSAPQTSDGSTGTATAGPNDGPDPNCARLTGSPTPYDASATPLVFSFDYVDSWSVEEPLQGPGGRTQGLSSPVVTVDGETESAGVTVGQEFDPLTAAAVDEAIADRTGGDYAPVEVAHEQAFTDETVRILGFVDTALPYYETWLPYGDGEARYYPVSLQLLTSILRPAEGELCLDATVEGIETVRRSLRPNPESTIAEV